MKNLIFLFLSVVFLSCEREVVPAKKELVPEIKDQTWNLVEVHVGLSGEVISKANLPFHETYIMRANQTFVKQRKDDGKNVQVNGTYEIISSAEETYFKLTYDSDHDLIENCSIKLEEYLYIRDNMLVNASASACDGPYLIYEKAVTTN